MGQRGIMKFWTKRTHATAPEEVLVRLPEHFRLPLLSMYAGDPQPGSHGEVYAIDSITRIDPAQGMWIYDLCRLLKPKKTAEIGLAYGFSTIFILAAIYENGRGCHLSIDPLQPAWHGIGQHQPERVAMAHAFRFIGDKSFPALVDLARSGERFELTFIDGNHRFDDVLIDFTLSAEMCPLGGYVVLDDVWMASIQRVVSFIRNNREDFAEVPTPISNVAAFKRIAEDMRKWDFHVNF
jgi:predicted O-methyltransferase YrrM